MTQYLNRTFSVPMPGNRGDWPWGEEAPEKSDEEPPEDGEKEEPE